VAKKKEKEINLLDLVVKGMQEKKALDITIIDLRKIKTAVADYFVICSANSENQVDAIYSSVDEEVWKETKQHPWHKEGIENKEWILLDYSDVVAHIFKKDRREFYALEELWGDADIVTLHEDGTQEAKPKKKVAVKADKKEVKKKTSKPKSANSGAAKKTVKKAVKPKTKKK